MKAVPKKSVVTKKDRKDLKKIQKTAQKAAKRKSKQVDKNIAKRGHKIAKQIAKNTVGAALKKLRPQLNGAATGLSAIPEDFLNAIGKKTAKRIKTASKALRKVLALADKK